MWERKQAPYPASNTAVSDVPGFVLRVQKDLGYRDLDCGSKRIWGTGISDSWLVALLSY